MADQITSYVRLTLETTNNTFATFNLPSLKITQNNEGLFENTVSLTTTDTKMSITNLTTYGVGYLQNVSATSTIVILVGADSTGVIRPFYRLKWKEGWPLRFNTATTYRAQCESSSGKLRIGVWED